MCSRCSALSRNRGWRGNEATRTPTIDASRARKVGERRSSLFSKPIRKEGSCGNGHRGEMYVKKSSTRSLRVLKGQICSALMTALVERDMSVWATLSGEDGAENIVALGDSSRRFLIASACRFGGPLRRLGLSLVHGISNAAQARHGTADSSHCRIVVSFEL